MSTNGSLSTKRTTRSDTRSSQSNASEIRSSQSKPSETRSGQSKPNEIRSGQSIGLNDKPPNLSKSKNGDAAEKSKPADLDEATNQPPERAETIELSSDESVKLSSDESEDENEMNFSNLESQDYHSSGDELRSNNEEPPVIDNEGSESEHSVGEAEEMFFNDLFGFIIHAAIGGAGRPRNEPDMEMEEF